MELTPVFTFSAPGPSGKILSFLMQHQQQDQWCWSATSVSVNLFFQRSGKWQQCTLVNNAFKQSTCCNDGSSSKCNQQWLLDKALKIVGNFSAARSRRAQFNEVTQQIDSSRPLCLRIQWSTGGGHFVAIYGYSGTVVNIGDPWWGDSVMDFQSFPSKYQTGGDWTHSYWVVP